MKLLVVLCLYQTFGLAIDSITFSLISTFTEKTRAASAVFFSCWSPTDTVLMVKFMATKGMFINVHNPGVQMKTLKQLWTKYYHVIVVMDLHCEGSFTLLADACRNNYLRGLHHWLLLSSSDASEDTLIATLGLLNVTVDSHVTVAQQRPKLNDIILQDVYRIKAGLSLIFSPPCNWSPRQPLPPIFRRDNYQGITLNAATVVIEDTWDNFLDMRYKHLNTLSKCNFVLMSYISIILNFTMNLTITDTWGYPRKDSPCYDGIVGLMECGDVEIGAIGLLQKDARLDRIDYAGETVDFGGQFMFLKPSLSEVSVIYTLPFKSSVWVAYIAVMSILTVAMFITHRMEHQMNPSQPALQFGDAVLNSLALMCQEGTSRSPESLSSRIVFLFILMLSLFLTTSYSATIVSLLQTPSTAINSLTELIDSSFKLSMREIAYNTKLVNDTKDPEIKKLFQDKLYQQPYHQAFTSQEKGVEKLRKGLYAFYGDAGAYKIMSDTYEENEKCRLKEITINPSNALAFPVKKGSQYKEHITQKAQWLKEAGLIDREYKRWFVQRPKCNSDSRGFVSVRIGDFYPTLVVLATGIIGAIILFILEILYHKLRYGVYFPRKSDKSQSVVIKDTDVKQYPSFPLTFHREWQN